jgi:acyl transferase domain-containing protein/acyl carrier protein
VFSVQLESHDEEKVVAVAELRQPISDAKAKDDLVLSIKTAVARAFDGLELHDVVLVKEHTVPKTSSGKLMRFACRYSYLQASLARLDTNGSGSRNASGGLVSGVVGKLVQAFKPRKEALQRYIVNKVAEAVDLDAANIDPACDVRSYGMDSLRQMQLLRELEDRLGCALPTSLCDEYNSIEQIVDLLLSDAYTKISPRLTKFIDEELSAFKPEKRRQRRKGGFELKREEEESRESQAKEEEDDEDLSAADVAALPQAVTPTLEDYPGRPIAIVGMACRVPKARNLGEFWNNLDSGVDAISQIPADRWNAEAFYDPDMDKPGKMPTTQGGFLDDIDKFDASFFHIGAREAEVMDPQQRMVLEVVYEALEDAGMSMDKIRGSRTGVFTGVCFSDYHKVQVADPDKIRPYVQTGCASSIVPNRISYFYDLKGPSFTVDTACSSSLVALHLACESIQRGECDRAIVAGTSTNLLPEMFIAFAKLHMLSPNGRCKAFDASGDGYVRSEGVCVLIIEPLATAARDRDSVRALVRATGTNQDGRTAGLTFPGREAQAALLREVYSRARLTPFDVQFIEAHGTGTRAGDPVETGAIGSVLGQVRPSDNPLLIGSVKSNIGHLEGASGLAGVIKAVLAMQNGVIPANLHFSTPNPDIDFDGMRLKVAASKLPWPECSVRRAGVNSFGFGGSNAHAIIEQAPLVPALVLPPSHRRHLPAPDQRTPQAFPVILSAHTKQALTELQQAYAARLADVEDGLGLGDDDERLMDLAYTLACRRSHHAYRLSTVVSSAAELATELPKAKIAKMPEADKAKQVLFVFTGQGAQWYAMGRQLLRDEPIFRDCMHECDRIVRRLVGWSILDVLAQDEATSIINRPDIAQPCTTSLQVSLVRLWRHWGVEPSIVVGHSSGEIATAYAAGALSLEATIRTAVFRGEAMKVNESGRGKMAAVGMTEQEASEFLITYQGKVGIAAVNSPTNCTISGDAATMDEIGAVLKERGVFCQFLRIDCAYHSHHMIPVGDRLTELLAGLETQGGEETRVPMISTVLGGLCKATDLGADYWVRNLVSMVRFWPAIEAAFRATRIDIVVEIGPHPALQGPLRQCLLALTAQPPAVLPSLIRKEDEQRRMALSLCALHDAGVEVAWERVFRDKLLLGYREPRLVRDLPSFPWQRKSFWHESDISRQSRFRELGHELLGHRLRQAHGAAVWQNELKVSHLPYLKDHVVQGSIVFPGAGYIAMAAAIPADAESQPKGDATGVQSAAIEEIVFKKALLFDTDQTTVKTQLTLSEKEEDGRRDFTVFSADGSGWQEHCSGKHRRLAPNSPSPADCSAALEANKALMQAVKERCPHFVSKDECYKVFNDAGLEYGPDFQGTRQHLPFHPHHCSLKRERESSG